jgi:glyoxylase-like metal-dependent hydrolase (beta-lactamase superfamily II)
LNTQYIFHEMKVFNLSLFIALAEAAAKDVASSAGHMDLRVQSHTNNDASFNMVSSLIIGSEAAVLIDLPLAIPQAKSLVDWVRNTTDKPLIAVFTTHFHPDHYLSGAAFLSHFPEAKYYANSKTVAQIQVEAGKQVSLE